jgi:hypothetical protein
MKRLSSDQNGIGHLAVLVLVVTVAVVAGIGYKVTNGAPTTPTTTASVTASTKTKAKATAKNTATVDAATKGLDATDVNGSVDPSQLDADVNNLL